MTASLATACLWAWVIPVCRTEILAHKQRAADSAQAQAQAQAETETETAREEEEAASDPKHRCQTAVAVSRGIWGACLLFGPVYIACAFGVVVIALGYNDKTGSSIPTEREESVANGMGWLLTGCLLALGACEACACVRSTPTKQQKQKQKQNVVVRNQCVVDDNDNDAVSDSVSVIIISSNDDNGDDNGDSDDAINVCIPSDRFAAATRLSLAVGWSVLGRCLGLVPFWLYYFCYQSLGSLALSTAAGIVLGTGLAWRSRWIRTHSNSGWGSGSGSKKSIYSATTIAIAWAMAICSAAAVSLGFKTLAGVWEDDDPTHQSSGSQSQTSRVVAACAFGIWLLVVLLLFALPIGCDAKTVTPDRRPDDQQPPADEVCCSSNTSSSQNCKEIETSAGSAGFPPRTPLDPVTPAPTSVFGANNDDMDTKPPSSSGTTDGEGLDCESSNKNKHKKEEMETRCEARDQNQNHDHDESSSVAAVAAERSNRRCLRRISNAARVLAASLHLAIAIVTLGAAQQKATVRIALDTDSYRSLFPDDYNTGTMCAWNYHHSTSHANPDVAAAATATLDIRTFGSLREALDANYTVVHCGACGHCSNWDDLRLQWITKEYLARKAKNCATKGFFGTTDDVQQCNEETIGFSTDCARCWTVDEGCARDNCFFIFLQQYLTNQMHNYNVGPETITLSTCDEALCGPEFLPCSGASRRRMNIVSDIPRPSSQQCHVANEEWLNVWGYWDE